MADSITNPLQPPSKRQRTEQESTSQAIVPAYAPPPGPVSSQLVVVQPLSDLVFREQERLTLELNPLYLRTLKDRNEIGYQRPSGQKKLPLVTYEINIPVLHYTISNVLSRALAARYYAQSSLRSSEIDAEINELVPLVVDICMSALYSKLRNMHKSYGRHSSRYGPPSAYTKDIEIPLPFALAIQEFGAFETHSLVSNFVLAPTYAEGVPNEGRQSQQFNLTEYQSYLPTLKNLGIPCKSVDTRVKAGSAWWTYYAETHFGTHDLVCTLPFSHYSDLSAVIRSVLLYPGPSGIVDNIVYFPSDVQNYGTRMREMRAVDTINSFMALCHRPEEEWSSGPS